MASLRRKRRSEGGVYRNLIHLRRGGERETTKILIVIQKGQKIYKTLQFPLFQILVNANVINYLFFSADSPKKKSRVSQPSDRHRARTNLRLLSLPDDEKEKKSEFGPDLSRERGREFDCMQQLSHYALPYPRPNQPGQSGV